MSELDDNRDVRPSTDRVQDPRHRAFRFIGVEAHVRIGDAPFRRDRGCFDRQERRARESKLAQMNHVPVGHASSLGGVLTHGSNDDSIGQLKVADTQGGEQFGEIHG